MSILLGGDPCPVDVLCVCLVHPVDYAPFGQYQLGSCKEVMNVLLDGRLLVGVEVEGSKSREAWST